jgi:hypothetical protein
MTDWGMMIATCEEERKEIHTQDTHTQDTCIKKFLLCNLAFT